MNKSIILLCSLVLAACATGYSPSYSMREVQAVNLTGATIENVSWRVLGSEKTLACDQVARFAMCADYFASRRYPQAGIEVNWTHGDGARRAEVLNPHVPAYFSSAFPLRIVLEINADATVEGFYEQDEPDGGLFIND